jgi:hypothetical protein
LPVLGRQIGVLPAKLEKGYVRKNNMKVVLVLLAGCVFGQASTLEDGYSQMYNLQFEQAHQTFREWQRVHPADPLGPASDAAAYLFSEFDRLHILQSEFFSEDTSFLSMHKLTPDPQVKRDFEGDLGRARQLAMSGAPGDPNVLFAMLMTSGLESDYLALIEKRYLPALSETKQARADAERLLLEQPGNYDAYLAIGIENYLLSLKPAPMRWILRMGGAETDRETGIDKLKLTAESGHYLKPFARLMLAVAALRDKDRGGAREQLTWLTAQFPMNHLFREELAKVK